MDTQNNPPYNNGQNNLSGEQSPPVQPDPPVSQPIFSGQMPIPPPAQESQNVIFAPTTEQPKPAEPVTPQPATTTTPPATPPVPPQQPPVGGQHLEEEQSKLPMLIKLGVGFVVLLFFIILLSVFVFSRLFVPKNDKVTLQWWGLWEDPAVMQPLINQFEKLHPNITIQYSKQDPQQYSERLLTRIANGNGPDIFRFHESWMPVVQRVLSPLSNDAISKQDFTQNYYPFIQQDLTRNGAIYGLPLEVDTLALFTNDQLFQSTGLKPPTNWTDFITAARALTVKDSTGKIKTAGAALGTYDNITHAPDIVSLLFFQNGANIYNLSSTAQNASDSLVFYTSFAQGDSNVWDSSLDPSINAFEKGNLAMYFGYSYDVFTIKALNPNLSFTVSPVPHLLGRNSTLSSYWVEGVSNKSKHQAEDMLFMNYLASKQAVQELYSDEAKTRLFGEPYARIDLADSLKNDPLAYPFILQAKTANSSFFAGETYDDTINGQVNGYLGNAIRSILSGTSSDTAVSTLSQGVAQVLNRYASTQQQ